MQYRDPVLRSHHPTVGSRYTNSRTESPFSPSCSTAFEARDCTYWTNRRRRSPRSDRCRSCSCLEQLVLAGSQFVVATHSPILPACPPATIYQIGASGVEPMVYEETENSRVTWGLLNRYPSIPAEPCRPAPLFVDLYTAPGVPTGVVSIALALTNSCRGPRPNAIAVIITRARRQCGPANVRRGTASIKTPYFVRCAR
jgi:hypothetical protein